MKAKVEPPKQKQPHRGKVADLRMMFIPGESYAIISKAGRALGMTAEHVVAQALADFVEKHQEEIREYERSTGET